ncbi:exosortase A [Aquisediminimonas sediminicola]|uniref:exosortase A n=1 Tax=Alteraquisediminimonas sediminicola TaxID=2676787 RepID=UPI001C8D16EF|nr:exosortase A [Aquisediminimonas sediminicola]
MDDNLACWRHRLRALALIAAAILLLFARDVADMAAIWWDSSTFAHCLFLPPIIGWLIWESRRELAQLEPMNWWPGLIWTGIGAFGWMLGDAAGVNLARHAGVVVMLQGAVLALLGPVVCRGLAFPLFYLLFMIPAGEELVPLLQTITAKICMFFLDLIGLPARIDGIFIATPTGYFKVAEACSGIKFLVAMAAYATLAAYVCFRTWQRQVTFIVFALLMSVLAHGLRAWGTIYISHLTSIDFAASFDHVFYGWFFFAGVMILVMAAGYPFFNRPRESAWIDLARLQAMPAPKPQVGILTLAGAALAVAAAPVGWSALMAMNGQAQVPTRIVLPQIPGWRRVHTSPKEPWTAHFSGADYYLQARFAPVDGSGAPVDLAIAYYGNQYDGREIVGFGQGAIGPESRWAWASSSDAPPHGAGFRMIGPGHVSREVAVFYDLNDVVTGDATRVKLETLRLRLLGGKQRAVAVIVTAEDMYERSSRPIMDRFIRDLGPIDLLADKIEQGNAH